MKKAKLLLITGILVFAVALPVGAAQLRGHSTNAANPSSTEDTEEFESVSEYARNRVQELKNLKDAEKEAAKEKALERIRERVLAMIQNAVRRYERVITQVKNAEGLSDEEKATIESKVTAQIQAMNTLETQVEAADTVGKLKKAMVQVKNRFRFSLGLVRQAVSGVFEDRLSNVLDKLTSVYSRLDEKVAALADGDEKTELTALMAEAQALLTEAKENIDTGEFVTAKENLIDAHANLQDVAESLRN